MENIVKSVVFAAVVLFAGIAAMQVIYKNQDIEETKNNFYEVNKTPVVDSSIEERFMSSCKEEKPEYECILMWSKK